MTKVSRSAAIAALLRGEEVWTGVCPEGALAFSCCELDLAAGKLLNALRALRMATSCCRDMRILVTGLGRQKGRNPLLFF